MMHLLLLGATGLVGSHVLTQALADREVTRLTAPVRRALPAHERVDAPIVDFERIADWPGQLFPADAVICCLGSTMKQAGSRERFHRIDHDYVIEIACRAREAGTPAFVLNSAVGADPRSAFFYNRVKGETERDVAALGFASTVMVRPGLLGGERTESRPLERAGMALLGAIALVLPRGWRINPAENVARAMLSAAKSQPPGVTIIPARDLA